LSDYDPYADPGHPKAFPWEWLVGFVALAAIAGLIYLAHGNAPGGRFGARRPARMVAADPEAAPGSGPLGEAFRAYRANQPQALRTLAAQVRSGQVRDKAGGLDRLKATADPFARALDAAFARHSDPRGNVTDPPGLAAELESAAGVAP